MSLKLKELFHDITDFANRVAAVAETEITELCNDARKVIPGAAFIAVKGYRHDGHDFLEQAVDKGAALLVVEDVSKVPGEFKGLVFQSADNRELLQKLSANWFSHPSKQLFALGVTGTNGKTSITYLFEHVLNLLRLPCGVIGTINHHLQDQVWDTSVTTPGVLDLQMRLRQMHDAGAKAVAIEVSSHAIAQKRVDGVHFNVVVFTNLTRDHLDYHQDMQSYFAAKQRLFTELLWQNQKPSPFAIINVDDEWGAKLRVASPAGLWTYGKSSRADFCFNVEQVSFTSTQFQLKSPFGTFNCEIPMCGEHNVYNCVAVVASAALAGIPVSKALESLKSFQGVPGRLQPVPNERSLNVFVDYAHSPDALKNVLQALIKVRESMQAKSKIWTIFGCGGDRDKGKRPLMAQAACQYSDFVMITSDNPRTEDPNEIIDEIFTGVGEADRSRVYRQVDRKQAIAEVIAKAQLGDVILIAGKGHEEYQIVGHEKSVFSDLKTAQELLS